MRLKQHSTPGGAIPLVPMIDVLMIMLIFFMVTSTYLNLRMIPMAERADGPAPVAQLPAGTDGGAGDTTGASAQSSTLLIRLDATGQIVLRGQPIDHAALGALLSERLDADPALGVILLPSGQARTQDLVSLLDTTTSAGIGRLRVVRLGEGP